MRPFLSLALISLLILSCGNSKKTAPQFEKDANLIGRSYYDYREIPYLKSYVKVSDTSFTAKGFELEYEITHRITELKENGHILILFNKISLDDQRNEINSILDTLGIDGLDEDLLITIGYCESGNLLIEQTIAIVEKTDNDTIQKIISAWKGNPKTGKIERIEDFKNLKCINEFWKIKE